MGSRVRLTLLSVAIILAAGTTLLFPSAQIVRSVHGSSVTILLLGDASLGWNNSVPGPTITVHQGDTVILRWSDQDGAPHYFLLDIDNDGLDTSDCSPAADPCTPTTSTTTGGSVTFTANTSGNFTYYCPVHPTTMYGSFDVLPATFRDFAIVPGSTTLTIAQGATATTPIALSSYGGFKANLTLTGTVSPPGPGVSFSPSSVSLSPGGRLTSAMTVSAAGGSYGPVAIGGYAVTLTVTNGTLAHSLTILVTVSPGPSAGANFPTFELVGVSVAIVASVGVIILLWRKRLNG